MPTIRNAVRVLITILAVATVLGTTQAAGKPRNIAPQGQIAKAAKPTPRQFAKDYLNPAITQKNGNSSGIWLPGTYSRAHGKRPGR